MTQKRWWLVQEWQMWPVTWEACCPKGGYQQGKVNIYIISPCSPYPLTSLLVGWIFGACCIISTFFHTLHIVVVCLVLCMCCAGTMVPLPPSGSTADCVLRTLCLPVCTFAYLPLFAFAASIHFGTIFHDYNTGPGLPLCPSPYVKYTYIFVTSSLSKFPLHMWMA